jgi:DNA-binding CsgD family transcriptional regulator
LRRTTTRRLRTALGLSAAQTQLLLALADGRRVSQLAAELKLPPSTVRSRLVVVRRKTGHERVDDLLRTLWSLPPALAGVADGK